MVETVRFSSLNFNQVRMPVEQQYDVDSSDETWDSFQYFICPTAAHTFYNSLCFQDSCTGLNWS